MLIELHVKSSLSSYYLFFSFNFVHKIREQTIVKILVMSTTSFIGTEE